MWLRFLGQSKCSWKFEKYSSKEMDRCCISQTEVIRWRSNAKKVLDLVERCFLTEKIEDSLNLWQRVNCWPTYWRRKCKLPSETLANIQEFNEDDQASWFGQEVYRNNLDTTTSDDSQCQSLSRLYNAKIESLVKY